ncbi:MAG: nitrite/sulfite reductase [Alphaproteobacteria bacterium]|jgi:sulfite reductase (NADPH) hemoprotein beta-component|nr:nitrite/sulfite reductase [Alphaproteobacteria bacterium]MDP6815544.1 nitrite/sulfite reductase [Alphaproteobacteria bacterium]
MYRYDEFDQAFVAQRVDQFRDQVARRIDGELSEDEFKPLRLMNGLYLQLHAYMLRVAIPYGVLSARQMRRLAHIARTYDRGYGHFTTRQNIQFNWPKLAEVPDLLAELAEVEMHAIQTSGNCIRNVTADPLAGVAPDEIEDPRVHAEIIRQWSTLHPEFAFLPRKFKIAVTGAPNDRAVTRGHDIGLRMHRDGDGRPGFEVMVGGGQGRTPILAKTIRPFLPAADLLSYLEAILRVYNQLGRRDNIYKARIKILVEQVGVEAFAEMVEAEWRNIRHGELHLPAEELARIAAYFAPPAYEKLPDHCLALEAARAADPGFASWLDSNVEAHKQPGYAVVTISLKPHGGIPGDATAEQMEAVADLAAHYSFGEIRVTYKQNLVLADVRKADLHELWLGLRLDDLATANAGLVSDIIACPGLDYCNLANARSIPIAQEIGRRFRDIEREHGIGPVTVNVSGCINACAHHHMANIGILGVDKKGSEAYQITLGGRATEDAAIGAIIGPAVAGDQVADAVETIVDVYLAGRRSGEAFIDTYRRTGPEPFKEKLYATA